MGGWAHVGALESAHELGALDVVHVDPGVCGLTVARDMARQVIVPDAIRIVLRSPPVKPEQRPVELERLLLDVVWRDLERRSEGHEFDFEAVLLYCLRWEVIARWTRYTSEAATTRFDHLVREGLAGVDLDSIAA